MLFLQYFVQGAYFSVASLYLLNYLHFTATQVGIFGSAAAFGAVLAPVIAGQVADRYVSTERFLALSHFLGGIIMLLIWRQTTPVVVLALTFVYSLLYVPTMSLTNTMCFRNLRNREQEFPILRSCGTIGFIAAQWLFEVVRLAPLKDEPAQLLAARGDAFFLSGAAGVLLAAYCLTLPRTPPIQSGVTKFAPVEAIRLLADRGFLVLFVISLPIAIVHSYHFVWVAPYLAQDTGIADEWIGRVTTVGQIFEILVLALLGLGLKRMGFKWTLTLGISAYVLRNLIFAAAPPVPIVVAAQALHGFCFACFFATAFMLVDRLAPQDARASVQTSFNIIARRLER
jgi:predicted MFS family arabinose efflux permease